MSVYFPYLYKEATAPVKIVTWADGTEDEIAAMLAAADAGKITLSDYWSLGDERTVHLSAMTAGDSFTAAMDAQDVVLVLMDTGAQSGYVDVNDNLVNFVVGQKGCLSKNGRIKGNTGGAYWSNCAMRTDLNDKYYNALPSTFKSFLKQFKTITYNKGQNELETTLDYIALFAEKEVIGKRENSAQSEVAALTQIDYYKIGTHKQKGVWWTRSINSTSPAYYCTIYTDGSGDDDNATYAHGISPFMCI